jgi:hypothetical protein
MTEIVMSIFIRPPEEAWIDCHEFLRMEHHGHVDESRQYGVQLLGY